MVPCSPTGGRRKSGCRSPWTRLPWSTRGPAPPAWSRARAARKGQAAAPATSPVVAPTTPTGCESPERPCGPGRTVRPQEVLHELVQGVAAERRIGAREEADLQRGAFVRACKHCPLMGHNSPHAARVGTDRGCGRADFGGLNRKRTMRLCAPRTR